MSSVITRVVSLFKPPKKQTISAPKPEPVVEKPKITAPKPEPVVEKPKTTAFKPVVTAAKTETLAPKPAPQPVVKAKEAEPEAKAEPMVTMGGEKKKKPRQSARRYGTRTVYTSPLGIGGQAETARRTLLGV